MTEQSNSDSIACPVCGQQNSELWEHELDDGDSCETECGWCEKPFRLRVRVTYTYTATRLESGANGGVPPLNETPGEGSK